MDEKKLEEALKKISDGSKRFIPQKCGGILVEKCPQCDGVVVLKGEGVLFEVCSSCGREYHETVYRA